MDHELKRFQYLLTYAARVLTWPMIGLFKSRFPAYAEIMRLKEQVEQTA